MVTLKLAWRYAFSRSNRHRSAMFVIMFGIAVGMLAIIIMLSLMNSLQSDLLDQVKSVESFHLQMVFPPDNIPDLAIGDVVSTLASIDHVTHVFPHVNTQVLLQNVSSDRSTTARLRIVDSSIWDEGNPFSQRAHLLAGTVAQGSNMVLGTTLAITLGMRSVSDVKMTLLASGKAVVLAPMTISVGHGGTFVTGLPEFDSSTVMMDLDALVDNIGANRLVYGLYLDDATVDHAGKVVQQILDKFPDATVRTWQQVNSAFYSALMLEKVLMYVFLFFMFIILGVNMKNAASRLLHVKQRELAILRAVGARRRFATGVFLGQTAIVTIIGETIGVVGGLLLGTHIGAVFSFFNSVQYVFTQRDNVLLSYPFTTQVRSAEVTVIVISVLLLSLLFTYIGCRRLLRREPMEMLYHD